MKTPNRVHKPEHLQESQQELRREHCIELRAPGAPRSVGETEFRTIARTQDEFIRTLVDRGYRMMDVRGRG